MLQDAQKDHTRDIVLRLQEDLAVVDAQRAPNKTRKQVKQPKNTVKLRINTSAFHVTIPHEGRTGRKGYSVAGSFP